ncbi:MAG: glycosyl hydrolase [Ideonella sp.]|nr:glycosyl hydrolase [Ideonella sp.]
MKPTHARSFKSLQRLAAAGLLACATATGLVACGSGGSGSGAAPLPPAIGAGPVVDAWVTTGDRTRLLAKESPGAFGDAAVLPIQIEVDAAQRFQKMAGFGASITDASAWLIHQRMSEPQREALLQELFGRANNGQGFNFTRLTIGASDFSRSHYSLDDRPVGETDPTLQHFSIEPNRADLLPVLKRALAINPQLSVMASPWSAPGWMKVNGSLIKGALRTDMHGVFADYLVRYVQAYAAEGVPIFALTLQNEPHFEPGDYPGMRLDSAARASVVGKHLGPKLQQLGLKTQLIEWDHNWDDPAAPLAMLSDPVARPFVAGVAWHCYAGEAKAQQLVRDTHPDKDTWFTECSGGEWKTNWAETLPWLVRNVLIGSTRYGARGVLMWNLALDENFGPHLGGCKDCRGVVTIDSNTGAVTRNMEYYMLGHASRFVRPGAERIASSTVAGTLDTVAFRNADDGSIVLIVCNSTASEQRFTVRSDGQGLPMSLPRESVATLVWKPTK